jgi:hypothetical protein
MDHRKSLSEAARENGGILVLGWHDGTKPRREKVTKSLVRAKETKGPLGE